MNPYRELGIRGAYVDHPTCTCSCFDCWLTANGVRPWRTRYVSDGMRALRERVMNDRIDRSRWPYQTASEIRARLHVLNL